MVLLKEITKYIIICVNLFIILYYIYMHIIAMELFIAIMYETALFFNLVYVHKNKCYIFQQH